VSGAHAPLTGFHKWLCSPATRLTVTAKRSEEEAKTVQVLGFPQILTHSVA